MITSALAYIIGCFVFSVNPFEGNVPLALAFVLVGLIPLYGVAMLFGALVLKGTAGVVSGTVVDSSGKPIPDARVFN